MGVCLNEQPLVKEIGKLDSYYLNSDFITDLPLLLWNFLFSLGVVVAFSRMKALTFSSSKGIVLVITSVFAYLFLRFSSEGCGSGLLEKLSTSDSWTTAWVKLNKAS